MLFHQRWRGSTKWLMASWHKSTVMCLSRWQRRQKGSVIWIERTCFRHGSLKVLKDNKSPGNHLKSPYWRMKLNAGLFDIWNKASSFSRDCLSTDHCSGCTALNPILHLLLHLNQKLFFSVLLSECEGVLRAKRIFYLVTIDLSHSILWVRRAVFERECVVLLQTVARRRGCCRARIFYRMFSKQHKFRHLFIKASLYFIRSLPSISPGITLVINQYSRQSYKQIKWSVHMKLNK